MADSTNSPSRAKTSTVQIVAHGDVTELGGVRRPDWFGLRDLVLGVGLEQISDETFEVGLQRLGPAAPNETVRLGAELYVLVLR